MTSIIIYVVFGIIVLIDIFLLISKNGTITSVFRHWYKEFPFVPYMVGGAFIGHFGLWIDFSFIPHTLSMIIFISLSVLYLIYNIISRFNNSNKKLWSIQKKVFLIPMFLGAVIGCCWY